MKILITSPTYLPEVNGLANAVKSCADILMENGHSVTVATSGLGVQKKLLGNEDVVRFNCSGSLTIRDFFRGNWKDYVRWVKAHNFDIIIAHAWHCWSTEALLLDNSGLPPIVVCSHGTAENIYFSTRPLHSIIRMLNYLPFRLLKKRIYSNVSRLIVLSSYGEISRFQDFKYFLKLRKPISIIPNLSRGVIVRKDTYENRPKYIISVGSYDWSKGNDRVLQAYAGSAAKNKIPIYFYGQINTIFRENLIKLANFYEIDPSYIEFNIDVTGDALFEKYCNAYFLAVGSHTECQSLSILDAHAARIPFVSFNIGDAVRRKSGIVVNNVNEMTAAFNAMLSYEMRDLLASQVEADLFQHSQEEYSRQWAQVIKDYTSGKMVE